MKIIYVIGNRIGASLQAARILPHLKNHQIKIAGYAKNSEFQQHLDWTLDSLTFEYKRFIPEKNRSFLGNIKNLKIDTLNLQTLLEQIREYSPDLIINDSDRHFALIATVLKIEWWLVTPLLLYNAFEKKYYNFRYYHSIDGAKNLFVGFYPDKKITYSPFCDILNSEEIKFDYQLVRPYYKKIENNISNKDCLSYLHPLRRELRQYLPNINYIENYEEYNKKLPFYFSVFVNFLQTDLLSDLIYNNKQFFISPYLKDDESCINASLISKMKLSHDFGQIEFMKGFAEDEYQKFYKKRFNYKININPNVKQLHELL